MVRHTELPFASELPVPDDDLALFDPSPDWFIPGMKSSLREDGDDDDTLGFRSLIEEPDALTKAWRTTGGGRAPRVRRAKRRRALETS